jgi:hypothetical protein
MRAYRPLLSLQQFPIVAVARSVVSADVSVAWQWIFSDLGKSAVQTTCHINNFRETGYIACIDCIDQDYNEAFLTGA